MADWLFSSGNCERPHRFAQSERLRFRHGATRAYLEEAQVLPGIWLYRGEATPGCRFTLDVGDASREGRLILGCVLASRGLVNLEGCDDLLWRDEGRFYMLSPTERRCHYEIDAEHGWRIVAVRVEPEAMDLLGSNAGLPQVVSDTLRMRRDDVAEIGTLPGIMRRVGQGLLRQPFEGRMGRLFLQSRVLELLARQLDHVGDGRAPETLAAPELARVRMARDIILSDLREPPGLEELSKAVGLTSKRLNRGFRDLYGSTVFAYLHDARLDAARAALEAGSPLPLKQLAWELGYGQVTNFVTAFRRRFGVTPGSLREGNYAPRK